MRVHPIGWFVAGSVIGLGAAWLAGMGADSVLPEVRGASELAGSDGAERFGGALHEGRREPHLSGVGGESIEGLRAQLSAARARIAALEARPAASAPSSAQSRSGTPASSPPAVRPLPATVAKTAEALGVSERAIGLAWTVRAGREPARSEALARLKALGEEGLRALAAISLTPRQGHTALPALMAGLQVPGAGALLLDLAREHPQGAALTSALGHHDTPAVRDFLVSRVAASREHAGEYWHVAEALGRLAEPRGAEHMRLETITQVGWNGVRGHILSALGQMGGSHAARLLTDYLEVPGADQIGTAVAALAELDAPAARAQAQRILASEQASFLPSHERRRLEGLAAEED